MKKSFKQIILLMILISSYSFSFSVPEKYPSYAYVFAEFGVDESYVYDSDFELFVSHNEKKIKAFYDRSLNRGRNFLPMMKGYLMDDGLSDLFIYLSMIESGFSPAIVSPKKAVGLWQFMPATAKHYNLSVDNSFDERCDPVSSTNAAINYLTKLHRQFGKWYLAAMAYNCGEGRLEKAIQKAGSDELSILVDNGAKYLPLETREYIKKILLVAMIGEGTMLDFPHEDDEIIQVSVRGGTDLNKLAETIKIKSSILLNLNKQFKKGMVPKAQAHYNINIPYEKMIMFYLRYEDYIKEKNISNPYLLSHYVALGETIESIAKEYNSTTEEIQIANHFDNEFLELDRLLVIPVSKVVFENSLK